MYPFLKLLHEGEPSFDEHIIRLMHGREQFGKE